MSDAKDKEYKTLSREILRRQIQLAEEEIKRKTDEIIKLQNEIQQQYGIAGLAKHLIDQFAMPEKVEEKKNPDLEVK